MSDLDTEIEKLENEANYGGPSNTRAREYHSRLLYALRDNQQLLRRVDELLPFAPPVIKRPPLVAGGEFSIIETATEKTVASFDNEEDADSFLQAKLAKLSKWEI